MDMKMLKCMAEDAFCELNQFAPQMSSIRKLCYNDSKGYGNCNLTSKGEVSDIEVYNSIPSIATTKFGATMAALVAPPGTKFFDIIVSGDMDESEKQVIEQQLSKVSNIIFEHLTNSNWGKCLNQVMTDIASGTAGMLVTYDKNSSQLNFKPLDLGNVGFLEGSGGMVDYVFRKLGPFNKSKQKRMYPNIDFNTDNDIELIDCSYPNGDKYIYMLTDVNFTKVYIEQEWDTNPFIIFRWSQLANENRGRGILNSLISTIKVANIMQADILNASALVINPPIVTDKSSIINGYNVKIQPGGIITLADNMSRFSPMPFGGNLPFAAQEIATLNKDVSDALGNDILGQVGSSQLTATEVNARLQLASHMFGAGYNNITREGLDRMFSRVFELLEKFNVITSIKSFSTGSKKKLKFRYSSPLMHIQKQIDVQKILQVIQVIAQTTGQEAQQYINASIKLEELPNWVAKNLGVDMSLVNTDDEISDKLKEFAQQNVQQQLMQIRAANPAFGTSPVNTGVIQ